MSVFGTVIGIGLMVFGVVNYFYLMQKMKSGTKVEATVIEVINNKERKYDEEQRCYPKVQVMDGEKCEIFICSSAGRKGYDSFLEGEILTLVKYKSIFGRTKYRMNRSSLLYDAMVVIAGFALFMASRTGL